MPPSKKSKTTPLPTSPSSISKNNDSKVVAVVKSPGKKTTDHAVEIEEGRRIVARMSDEDVNELLERLEARCPQGEEKPAQQRSNQIKWDDVAFKEWEGDQCRKAWAFLKSCEKVTRNMWELVRASQRKFQSKAANINFRKKVISRAPDFPKQPPGAASGMALYLQEKYAEMTEHDKGPTFNYMQWYKQTSLEYNLLPDTEKAEWVERSRVIKEEYDRTLEQYYKQSDLNLGDNPVQYPGLEKKKSEKKSGKARTKAIPTTPEFNDAPQPPLTPLKSFLQAKFENLDYDPENEEEVKQLEEQYTEKYNKLSKSKKVKWIQRTIEEIDQYIVAIDEYREAHPDFFSKQFRVQNILTNDELSMWEKKHGKPQKPVSSVVEYFRQEAEAEGKIDENLSEEEKKNEAAKLWKSLDFNDQREYKLKHDLEQVQYNKDVTNYYGTLPLFLRPVLLPLVHKRMTKEAAKSQRKNDPATTPNGEASPQKTPKKRKAPSKMQNKREELSENDDNEEDLRKDIKVKKHKHKKSNPLSKEEVDTSEMEEEKTESPKKRKKRKP